MRSLCGPYTVSLVNFQEALILKITREKKRKKETSSALNSYVFGNKSKPEIIVSSV